MLHMQRALSQEGCMWMNMVKINQNDIKSAVHGVMCCAPTDQQIPQNQLKDLNNTYMKDKIERYYNIGASIGRCLGLFDTVNFVQYMLNLLEEYEVYLMY